MYTPPIVEEEEQEAAEEEDYEAQFEPAEAEASGITKPSQPALEEEEETKEAPHILVDLPPRVEQTVQEVAQQGGCCGVGRFRAFLMVLREELRHEEQWRLPVLPRNAFIDFKWRRPPPPEQAGAETLNPWYVLYRFVLLAYWSSWVTTAIVGAQSAVRIPPPVYEHLGYNALWLIYSTNWTAMLLWVYLVVACVSLIVSAPPAVAAPPDDGVVRAGRTLADSLRTVTWALRDTVAPACVMVTLLYWALLFPSFGYTNVVDVHLHLVNALIILADLWLSRQPYWLRHFYWPLLYLCTYIVFAGIYYAAGGVDPDGEDYIYPYVTKRLGSTDIVRLLIFPQHTSNRWLDFERPHITVPIIFLVVFVIFPIVHASLWALERRSRQLAKRRFEREEAEWAAGEEVKEELATRPGETGRRRRQRRQRLVSPAQGPGTYLDGVGCRLSAISLLISLFKAADGPTPSGTYGRGRAPSGRSRPTR